MEMMSVRSPWPLPSQTDSLGLASNFQSSLGLPDVARLGQKTVDPAVAAGEDRLGHSAEHGERRRRPLAVQDVLARRIVGPDELAGLLVQGDEAGGVGGGDVVVRLVDAVGRADQQQVAGGGDRAAGHVVLQRAELAHHVERPDDVGFVGRGGRLGGERPVVLAVEEALGVEADDFAAVGDDPEPVALDQGAVADALLRPVDGPAGGELLGRVLPEELAVGAAEGQQAAQVDVGRVAFEPAGPVVGGAEDLVAGDDRRAVGLRAELGDPADVLGGRLVPRPGLAIEVADVPLGRDVRARAACCCDRASRPIADNRRSGSSRRRQAARCDREHRRDNDRKSKAAIQTSPAPRFPLSAFRFLLIRSIRGHRRFSSVSSQKVAVTRFTSIPLSPPPPAVSRCTLLPLCVSAPPRAISCLLLAQRTRRRKGEDVGGDRIDTPPARSLSWRCKLGSP